DETGRVAVVVEVGYADVPELCSTGLTDDTQLSACLERVLPQQIKLRGDRHPCPLHFDRFEKRDVGGGNGTLAMFASADCGALPDELVVDWGLFFGANLDHVSMAKLAQPNAETKLAMLSKRAPRFVLAVTKPHTTIIATSLALLVVILAMIALLVRRRVSAR